MQNEILAQFDEKEAIKLALEMARYESYSGNEKGVAEYLAGEMERMGYQVELQEVEKDRPNVIGRVRGAGGGPSFMFNGHMDIDPIPMGYGKDPWDIRAEGRRLYGHGLKNMKAGVVSMVVAGAAIKRAKIPLKGDLIVASVVGELQGGIGTVDLIRRGIITDYGIVPEPTMLHIRTIHAGMCQFLIHTIGKACWGGATHKQKHVNAVEKMCKAMNALKSIKLTHTPRPDLPELPRIIMGNIMGGLTRDYLMWRPSYIPDFCTLTFEVRMVPGQTVEGIQTDIERSLNAIKAEDPDFEYEIEAPPAIYREPWRGNKCPMPALDLPLDHELVGVVRKYHQIVTGQEPPGIGFYDPGSYAGADSGHLFQAGCACLNYGPTGHDIYENSVDIDMMMTCAKVMALTAAEITTRGKGQTRR